MTTGPTLRVIGRMSVDDFNHSEPRDSRITLKARAIGMGKVSEVIPCHDAAANFEIDLTLGFLPPVRCVRPDEDVANQSVIS